MPRYYLLETSLCVQNTPPTQSILRLHFIPKSDQDTTAARNSFIQEFKRGSACVDMGRASSAEATSTVSSVPQEKSHPKPTCLPRQQYKIYTLRDGPTLKKLLPIQSTSKTFPRSTCRMSKRIKILRVWQSFPNWPGNVASLPSLSRRMMPKSDNSYAGSPSP